MVSVVVGVGVFGAVATRRVVVEVDVPEGMEWIAGMVEEMARRMTAYLLLEVKARGKVDDRVVAEAVEEARRRVWEMVRDAYTGG